MGTTILNKLTPAGVNALNKGEVLAIRVPDFLSAGECCRLAKAATASPHFRFGGNGFVGIGPGSFELPGSAEEYFGSAPEIQKILAGPFTALEQAIGRIDCPHYSLDKPMRPLTARRYTTEFKAPPHQDDDLTTCPWASSQLGISLTLVSPKSGGAIRLWDLAYRPAEYAKRKLADRFELDQSMIPPHDAEMTGQVGELLIIDARRIHAIDPITQGERVSVSGFIAVDSFRYWIWS